MIRSPLLASLALAVVLAPAVFASEEDFVSGLGAVRALLQRGFVPQAEKRLATLLEAHREKDYVLARRVEIESCAADCAFRCSYSAPRMAGLISGKLLSWNDRTGSLKVKYEPDRTADFEKRNGLYHPVRFRGPYSIEIRGERFPGREEGRSPGVIVCLEGETAFFVSCGLDRTGPSTYIPATIQRLEKGHWIPAASGDGPSPMKAGRSFVIKIVVDREEIILRSGGKVLLKAPKSAGLFGGFGIQHLPFRSILIQGEADPSWLEGVRAEVRRKARAAFDRTWSPEGTLPDWLLAGGKGASSSGAGQSGRQAGTDRQGGVNRPGRDRERSHPGKPFPDVTRVLNKAIGLYNGGRHDEGLAYVRGLPPGSITAESRAWLTALFLEGKGEYSLALASCEKSLRIDGTFFETLWLRAILHVRLKRKPAATTLLRELVVRFPKEPCATEQLARLLLDAGEIDEAAGVVRDAFRRGAGSVELEEVDRMLVKARNGPDWSRSFEARSLHYHVRSDVDYRTCAAAAKILEEAHALFAVHLERLSGKAPRRFPVYIFSSDAGYRAYFEGLKGKTPVLSSGVYLPELKQLLIRNLSDRTEWARTVRHEGFHQYLDRLLDEPPIWFNEGLALCFELVDRPGGPFAAEAIHPVHAGVLAGIAGGGKEALLPLERFLFLDFEGFHADARSRYAQAWALMHFLRAGPSKNRELFNRFFALLKAGAANDAAVRKVFPPSVLVPLQDAFDRYVRSLG